LYYRRFVTKRQMPDITTGTRPRNAAAGLFLRRWMAHPLEAWTPLNVPPASVWRYRPAG
jgi:hypothetical protein